jgi:hypothetical protein
MARASSPGLADASPELSDFQQKDGSFAIRNVPQVFMNLRLAGKTHRDGSGTEWRGPWMWAAMT